MEPPAGTFEMLGKHLHQPEYLHVLLNPLPVYGVALGALALVIALALRSRPAQITALVLVLLSAGAAWPVVMLGEKAYDNVMSMSVSDAEGNDWMDVHAQRATRAQWVFYLTALMAVLALAAPGKFPKTATPLVLVTLVFSLVSLGFGGWIAMAGGQVRHREFRGVPPPKMQGGPQKMRD